ncbi:RdgB/HAM1 family non-canonical purine NTP pyrophosphatase [Methylophilaceae bacterium]|jgi:XTP/dITP diphosphohydrolase|nr:RdgB/HAM1 family non-canonical purine NTP pyrophosphatase [Methylophilaceae bacterium]MDC1173143.1 RdgB/HAM1 family non-canonical purine NTP pyrophosphatase [Methylophilaceae bacterium]|tara:strand:+ start:3251 stop:3844 length:594 start_codon:yes stop_codon:yes gene_type:complete
MNKIVIATNNKKKLNEIVTILENLNIEAIPQSYFKIGESEEPFNTFIENALIKARYASKKTGLPAIADDSGLCVDILKGEPGIHSARFSGLPKSDENNNLKLLEVLKDKHIRKAHYYCAIVFIKSTDDPQPIIAEGLWQGEILEIPRGKNGFGYDPLFLDYKTNLSAAELSTEIKNKISHRSQALKKIKQKLKIIYG